MQEYQSKKISSLQNPVVKHLVQLRENPSYRRKCRRVLVTGVKLVKEISCLINPISVIQLESTKKDTEENLILVSENVLKKITGLQTPEPIAAEFPLPDPSNLLTAQRILVLDRISDPGNMGTLLRTALALGWEGALILSGCVDLFNEKVIRSSRAASFKLPYFEGTWQNIKELIQYNAFTPLIADTQGMNIRELSHQKKILLILSSESLGVDEKAIQLAKQVTIPMPGNMESLNVAVAGSILMYLLGNS
jgi:TrmH family RNA methyltransferase